MAAISENRWLLNRHLTEPTFGRYAEIPLEQMTSEQRNGYAAIIRARGMCPGPSKIWLEKPATMEQTLTRGVFYRGKTTPTEAERGIGVVLMLAKWGSAYANGRHEWIAQGSSGYPHAAIPVAKIERMIGLAPSEALTRRVAVGRRWFPAIALGGPYELPRWNGTISSAMED